jgi:RNA polymerase sigma-70 factor (ECF subfamily)
MSDLIRGLKAGDADAYGRLVNEYGDRLRRFAARMAGPEVADDITQEVFLRVYRSIRTFDPAGSLAAWIFTIANNLCVDHLRRRPPAHRTHRSAPDPSDEAEGREAREALRRAVASLPEGQKRVFHLREEAGLSFREIADLLGCPLGTALGRMHAAMTTLRKALNRNPASAFGGRGIPDNPMGSRSGIAQPQTNGERRSNS